MENKIEISEKTLRGIYLIMSGLPYSQSGAEVYPQAIPVMQEAQREILKLGKEKGFDSRGEDIK